jgi:hypothetical protein
MHENDKPSDLPDTKSVESSEVTPTPVTELDKILDSVVQTAVAQETALSDSDDQIEEDITAPDIKPYVQFTTAPNTVTMPNSWLIKEDKSTLDDWSLRLTMIPSNLRGFAHNFEQIAANMNKGIVANVTDATRWHAIINNAINKVSPLELDEGMGCLDRAAERPGADWTTTVSSGTDKMFAGTPVLKADNSGALLTGAKAIQRVTSMMSNLGQTLHVPMYASGFWLMLKAPTLSEWIALDNKIAFEKSEISRRSRGLALSNVTVVVKGHIMDFILDRVIDCSIADWTPELIRENLDSRDFPALTTYCAATAYTNGFPISIPCITDASKCMHYTRDLINLTKIVWTDSNKLSAMQKTFMSKRRERRNLEQLKAYRESFVTPDSNVFVVNDHINIEFAAPLFETELNQGYAWLQSLQMAIDEAFGQEFSGNRRDTYLNNQIKATSVRAWSHWIKRISISSIDKDDNEVIENIEDLDTINTLCVNFSSDNELADRLEKAVMAFINDSVVSLVAVPNFACPNCGSYHVTADGPNKHLLPIDPISYFFIVLLRRVLEAKAR